MRTACAASACARGRRRRARPHRRGPPTPRAAPRRGTSRRRHLPLRRPPDVSSDAVPSVTVAAPLRGAPAPRRGRAERGEAVVAVVVVVVPALRGWRAASRATLDEGGGRTSRAVSPPARVRHSRRWHGGGRARGGVARPLRGRGGPAARSGSVGGAQGDRLRAHEADHSDAGGRRLPAPSTVLGRGTGRSDARGPQHPPLTFVPARAHWRAVHPSRAPELRRRRPAGPASRRLVRPCPSSCAPRACAPARPRPRVTALGVGARFAIFLSLAPGSRHATRAVRRMAMARGRRTPSAGGQPFVHGRHRVRRTSDAAKLTRSRKPTRSGEAARRDTGASAARLTAAFCFRALFRRLRVVPRGPRRPCPDARTCRKRASPSPAPRLSCAPSAAVTVRGSPPRRRRPGASEA